MSAFDPDYVDWDAYLRAVYTPSPALLALPDYDSFWRTLGGQGFGFPELDDRAAGQSVGIPSRNALECSDHSGAKLLKTLERVKGIEPSS